MSASSPCPLSRTCRAGRLRVLAGEPPLDDGGRGRDGVEGQAGLAPARMRVAVTGAHA